MSKSPLFLFLFLFTLLPASAITLKLATPFPEGTEWHRSLGQMAKDWREITEGKVRIKIYPGGIAGTQSDVIRKMRFGQIDMTILTSVGMATIVPKVSLLALPFFLKTEEELDFVLSEIMPSFQGDFLKKGFTVLGWSKSGWVSFYSIGKVITPRDMRQKKLLVSPAEPLMIDAFKEMGFNVVPLDINNALMGLQSGMVEALYATPMGAAAYQWFALANNLLEMKIAPLVGGILISQRTWKRIPQRYHRELEERVARITEAFYKKAQDMDNQAMRIMRENGLRIHGASEEVAAQWETVVGGKDYSYFVGPDRLLSREDFDDYKARVETLRNR